jgi:hypothetical protein
MLYIKRIKNAVAIFSKKAHDSKRSYFKEQLEGHGAFFGYAAAFLSELKNREAITK